MSTTEIEVCRGQDGRITCHLAAGALAARLIHRDDRVVRIALVATVAMLLAGDDIGIRLRVGPSVEVEIVETGGMVAFDMRGGTASLRTEVTVGAGSTVLWSGQPLVISSGASVDRSGEVVLERDAVAIIRDTVVLGRSGEVGGDLLSSTNVTALGVPLLREELDLRAGRREDFAIVGRHRCLDTLSVFGDRLPDGPGVLQLAGPGSIVRYLGEHLHESTVVPVLADRRARV